jgi:hypothetical protein
MRCLFCLALVSVLFSSPIFAEQAHPIRMATCTSEQGLGLLLHLNKNEPGNLTYSVFLLNRSRVDRYFEDMPVKSNGYGTVVVEKLVDMGDRGMVRVTATISAGPTGPTTGGYLEEDDNDEFPSSLSFGLCTVKLKWD